MLSNWIEVLLHSRELLFTIRQKSVTGEVLAPSGHVIAVEIIAAVGLGQGSCSFATGNVYSRLITG